MQLTLNDYRVLPINEKVRLFLSMNVKNQVLTDISGVNNSKIAHLRKYPESVKNLHLSNVEKIEDAFILCVKTGRISLESCQKVLRHYSVSKDDYVSKILKSIPDFKINDVEVVPYTKDLFKKEFGNIIKDNFNLDNPHCTITIVNDRISELYNYRCDFLLNIKPYPTSDSKVIIWIDVVITKIPKVLNKF